MWHSRKKTSGLVHGNAPHAATLPMVWDQFFSASLPLTPQVYFLSTSNFHMSANSRAVCFFHLLKNAFIRQACFFHQTLTFPIPCRGCPSYHWVVSDFCHIPPGQKETLLTFCRGAGQRDPQNYRWLHPSPAPPVIPSFSVMEACLQARRIWASKYCTRSWGMACYPSQLFAWRNSAPWSHNLVHCLLLEHGGILANPHGDRRF